MLRLRTLRRHGVSGAFTPPVFGGGLLDGSESDGTNLLSSPSAAMTTGWSGLSATLTNAAALAPDGTTTASSLIENTSNDRHGAFQAFSATAGVSRTASVYAKYSSRQYTQIEFEGDNAEYAYAIFDLVNGTVTDSGFKNAGGSSVFTGATMQAAVNGGYKCSIVFTTSYAINYMVIALSNVSTVAGAAGLVASNPTYLGTSSGNNLWRPKVALT